MFGPVHIHRYGSILCHANGGIYIQFEDADGMNPATCCEDCRLRYRNITGVDIKNQPADKALLRAKTEYQLLNR